MKITLVVIGKTDSKWLQDGIKTFTDRIQHYITLNIMILPDIKNTRNMPVELQKKKEGQQLEIFLKDKSEIFLLDEAGITFSSVEFARFIEKKMVNTNRELIFVIGGPFGFSNNVTKMASGKISLSKLTFSHQMVRLLFAEQLYRAFTIIKGESYHNV